VVLGGRKVHVDKPRVRRGNKEVELPGYEQLSREDPLTERMLEQMVIGVSTRKYKRSLEDVPDIETFCESKSEVSRRFIAKTQEQLDAELTKPLTGREWVALLIDGIEFAGHVVVIVMGIDATGAKHPLGIREGSTENATLCRELLSDIIARGVPANRSILVVIDGAKGLHSAVKQVFGKYALVQRCQVHKRRNVLDQLPEDKHANVGAILSRAYGPAVSHESAHKQLINLVRVLEKEHPGAAASLREGLDETIAVKTLGISCALTKSLSTTNPIENLNGTIRRVSGRVRRWRDGNMILRWVATGVIEAARGFRRLVGYRDMPKLVAALRRRDMQLDGDILQNAG